MNDNHIADADTAGAKPPSVAFCKVEEVMDNDSMLAQVGVKRGDKLYTMDQMRDYALAFHKSRMAAAGASERAGAEKDAALTDAQIDAAIKVWLSCKYDGDDDDYRSHMRAAILAAKKESGK